MELNKYWQLIEDIAKRLYLLTDWKLGWEVMERCDQMPFVYKAQSLFYDLIEPFVERFAKEQVNEMSAKIISFVEEIE